MKNRIEIYGALSEVGGIPNYDSYEEIFNGCLDAFKKLFGEEIMEKHDIFIDNGYQFTGTTYATNPILNKSLFIKTQITDGLDTTEIIFQFGFTLTQVVFYSLIGFDKVDYDEMQYTFSTAMALAMLHSTHPDAIDFYEADAFRALKKYADAIDLAHAVDYSFFELRDLILDYVEKY